MYNTYVLTAWFVYLCVCVGQTGEPTKRLNQSDAICEADWCERKELCIIWWYVWVPPGKYSQTVVFGSDAKHQAKSVTKITKAAWLEINENCQ